MYQTCKKCGFKGKVAESIVENSAGVPMIKGECQECGAYILFVPYKESEIVKKAILHYAALSKN